MKLKSKLIMSGVALAACAATLTSTTYAWYTTNTTVSADGITGATASVGTSSIFISKDEGQTWAQSVTLTAADTTSGNFASAALVPLQYGQKVDTKNTPETSDDVTTTGFFDLGGSTSGTGNTTLNFKLWVRTSAVSTEAGSIDLYLNKFIVNSAAITTSDNLLQNKAPGSDSTALADYGIYTQLADLGGSGSVATYGVDASRALAMYTTANYEGGSAVTGLYDLESSGTKKASTGALQGDPTGLDALKYYNAVMGTSLSRTGATNSVTASEQTPLTHGTTVVTIAKLDQTGVAMTEIEFTVFLDGWDKYCFDACKNSSISIQLSFTTETKNNANKIQLH